MSKKNEELREVARPLVEYIRKNYHPHTTVIVDFNHAEVLEGMSAAKFDEEPKERMTLTDFVDSTIVKVRNDMCNNYCKFEKECGEAIDRGEEYPCPLDNL